MNIGKITISPPVVLAPMAGATSYPFRLLAREYGCGLVVSEMISARGLQSIGRRERSLLYFTEEERPIALQLFGSQPDIIAESACWIEEKGADLIDLNLGCPTRKIVRNGDGGALMKDPQLCSAIFEALVNGVRCPVTVKMRLGWDEQSINAPELARRAEEAGIKAVTVHGRTVVQGYRGEVNWELIRQVKKAVSIPVIGNGNIDSPREAVFRLKNSGCDGVMVGRAALGNPWIFRQIRVLLEEGRLPDPPGPAEKLQVILRHMELLSRLKGEVVAVKEMRGHTCWYIRGMPGANKFKRRLVKAERPGEIKAILEEVFGLG